MRLIGSLRSLERDDGCIVLHGPALEAIEQGSRLLIVPCTAGTTVDFELFASNGPPDSPPATVWDKRPAQFAYPARGLDE